MIAVTTEPHGDGWRWVLTGTQVYSTEAKAHKVGQLQLDATRRGHFRDVWHRDGSLAAQVASLTADLTAARADLDELITQAAELLEDRP